MDYYLAVVLRLFHILAAAATIGGTLLVRTALLPAAASLSEDARRTILDGIRKRWAPIVHGAIGLLLLTGLLNFFFYSRGMFELGTPESKLYNMLFGVKAILALCVFGLAEVLVGKSSTAEKMRANAKRWTAVNLVLFLLIVAISAAMSRMHTAPNALKPAVASSENSAAP
jgi:uncharacterized membrane protein